MISPFRIGFLGLGRLGSSLAHAFKDNQSYQLLAYDPALKDKDHSFNNLQITSKIDEVLTNSHTVFLCAKPVNFPDLLQTIHNQKLNRLAIPDDQLYLSSAACVPLSFLHRYLPPSRTARIMPSINCSFGKNYGSVAYYIDKTQFNQHAALSTSLTPLGMSLQVNSDQELEDATVLNGCAPAIVAEFLRIYARTASDYSQLPPETIKVLIMNAFRGTVKYLEENGLSPEELQALVCSPGGVTEQILADLKDQKIEQQVANSLKKGRNFLDQKTIY